jgi:biopolymer transport protein ExbD
LPVLSSGQSHLPKPEMVDRMRFISGKEDALMALGGKAGQVFTEINVTPLTDVFLVLLVIMVLIAPLVNQSVLKVEVPGGHLLTAQSTGPQITCDVSASGETKVNGLTVPSDTASIVKAIRAIQGKSGGQDLPLVLTSDAGALHKNVVRVMDAAAGCNIKRLVVSQPRS